MTKSGRFRENFWADTTIVWTRGTMGPRRPGTSARDKPGGSPSSGLAARSESSTNTQSLLFFYNGNSNTVYCNTTLEIIENK